jgi:hypothetical protein
MTSVATANFSPVLLFIFQFWERGFECIADFGRRYNGSTNTRRYFVSAARGRWESEPKGDWNGFKANIYSNNPRSPTQSPSTNSNNNTLVRRKRQGNIITIAVSRWRSKPTP